MNGVALFPKQLRRVAGAEVQVPDLERLPPSLTGLRRPVEPSATKGPVLPLPGPAHDFGLISTQDGHTPDSEWAKGVRTSTPGDATWSPDANPALREILDHIARQLAEKYALLVRETADKDAWLHPADKEVDE